MEGKNLFFFLILFSYILGIEEPETYEKLNDFKTISEKQNFKIMTTKESIAFFDSIDEGFVVKDQDNKNIDVILYNIVANKEYSFSTQFFNDKISSIFIRYVFPLDLSTEEIIIQDKTTSHLYLIKNKIFTFNFEKSSIKKTITLITKNFKC